MNKSVLFVGPIAEQGGPAIKNRILVTYLKKSVYLKIWNTYDRSIKARIGAIFSIIFSKQTYIIVAVSRKGRNILYPILLLKSLFGNIQYSCIVIGGNAAGSFKTRASIRTLQKADVVTVETSGLKKQMQDAYALDNIYYMPNYKEIEQEEIKVPAKDHFQGKELRFLFLSSMRDAKGVHVLFHAFKKVLEEGYIASLDYYGPIKSDLDHTLLEKIKSTEHINYCGVVDNNDVIKIMGKYQVFIFPTEYTGEGFPAVLVEALASGLPIIASDMNYNPEIITHGRNGWIFERGNEEQLTELIKYCIRHREKLCEISGNNIHDAKQYEAADVIDNYRKKLQKAGWPV